ncbi:MAG: TonB-dependent receptor [Saprospiraceae bacterium]|nr:TonB-dependent receptor [Saprospiraceae bacterium]
MPIKIYLFTLFLFFGFLGIAQNSTIQGRVLDEKGIALPEIPVLIKHPWGALALSLSTDSKGQFTTDQLKIGGYKLEIGLLGFETYLLEFVQTSDNRDFGNIQLKVSSKLLKEITVADKKYPGKILNDTVQFDASSYKVAKDASAEDLITKMPTVTNENGTVKAQNEDVKQVLVDGKPFFGNDPNLSLKNLPAELIDKIQIFDQQSEQSQFTGVNDGNTVKTINIVTKSGLNNGQFGKIYAGYNLNDKYQTGGNINYFDGSRRISLIAMSNNINIQNFSTDDILGALGNSGSRNRPGSQNAGRREFRSGSSGTSDFLIPQSGGIAKTNAIGLNYSDNFGKTLEINLSYFFNQSANNILSEINRVYFTNENIDQTYLEKTNSKPNNYNHRLQGRFELTLDSMNSIQIRPRLSYQSNSNKINNYSISYFNDRPGNQSSNTASTNASGFNFSNNILFRHKFNKPRRTFSMDWNMNSAPKSEDNFQLSYLQFNNPMGEILDTLRQLENNEYTKIGWSANFEYTEPITKEHSLLFNYRYQNAEDDTEVLTYGIPTMDGSSEILIPSLSNFFVSQNKSHQLGLGYQWNIDQKLNLSARVNWQNARLLNDQFLPFANANTKSFNNWVPSLFMRYTINKSKNLMIHYRTSTQLPRIEQLQNVVNNSNPTQLYLGNPNLKQSLQHFSSIRYNVTLPNSTLFFASVRLNISEDYITNHNFIRNRNHPIFKALDVPLGVQLSIPQNAGSNYQLRSYLSYTYPISTIKCLLSTDLSHSYMITPGLIDGDQINSKTHTLSLGLSLNSNISDKIDFNIQIRPSYNSFTNQNIDDRYFLYDNRLRVSWQFYKRMVIKTDANYRINESLQEGFNQNILLLNLAFGVKVFNNERGEFAIGVNDLFNQNQNLQRNIADTYYEDTYSNNLQRFLMVSFTYNLRNFNTGKRALEKEGQNDFFMRPREGHGRF